MAGRLCGLHDTFMSFAGGEVRAAKLNPSPAPRIGVAGRSVPRVGGVRREAGEQAIPAPAMVSPLLASTGRAASPEQARAVHAETGGNPFLVRELARMRAEQPGAAPGSVPGTVPPRYGWPVRRSRS